MRSQDQKKDDLKNEPLYGVIHSVLRDHLERGALIDGLVLGEASVARAFQTSRIPASIALKRLHKEPPINDRGRDRMLDGAIDVVAPITNLARLGEICGQFEACLPQIQPARFRTATSAGTPGR